MNQNFSGDIRDVMFSKIINKSFAAQISVNSAGIIAGSQNAHNKLIKLELDIEYLAAEGAEAEPGNVIARFTGNAKKITSAEDIIMGSLMKTSGIATATNNAVKLAQGKIRIVSGAWKKMPLEMKQSVREAIVTGGGAFRILDVPFVYLDKNYVRIFGSIAEALKSAEPLIDSFKVVQLRGEMKSIEDETLEAVINGAQVLMVDTGEITDVQTTNRVLVELGLRNQKQVAFAGGVKIASIPDYLEQGIDILDIGAQIVDAPLLDMKMDVLN